MISILTAGGGEKRPRGRNARKPKMLKGTKNKCLKGKLNILSKTHNEDEEIVKMRKGAEAERVPSLGSKSSLFKSAIFGSSGSKSTLNPKAIFGGSDYTLFNWVGITNRNSVKNASSPNTQAHTYGILCNNKKSEKSSRKDKKAVRFSENVGLKDVISNPLDYNGSIDPLRRQYMTGDCAYDDVLYLDINKEKGVLSFNGADLDKSVVEKLKSGLPVTNILKQREIQEEAKKINLGFEMSPVSNTNLVAMQNYCSMTSSFAVRETQFRKESQLGCTGDLESPTSQPLLNLMKPQRKGQNKQFNTQVPIYAVDNDDDTISIMSLTLSDLSLSDQEIEDIVSKGPRIILKSTSTVDFSILDSAVESMRNTSKAEKIGALHFQLIDGPTKRYSKALALNKKRDRDNSTYTWKDGLVHISTKNPTQDSSCSFSDTLNDVLVEVKNAGVFDIDDLMKAVLEQSYAKEDEAKSNLYYNP
ncbi:hypothetical protein AX774_g903 [Zancudomyces culisetae]|uniref:Uncharacterized protein n=1 Tax=Zancudomyces culisetae TaxID=1213189 RepID=A0A1R1PX93_ZANCU|nr:hypothetical protein AX774_g5205 [Zancudomyces culisetae]OMH85564.1 hypothetical protein AX774_g903 [Zancudomyces culisetae]|eukprot:OMH81344.1 hypothetical protein AX774_g5205 [Zancudomyces culisetae]